MKRLWKAAIAAVGVAALAGPVLAVSPAGATPPTGYGFDDTSHTIVGGGSDTTFPVQTDLSKVWNLSAKNGCTLNTTEGADLGKCVVTGSAETNSLVNWQRDDVSQLDDVGSTAGIGALNGMQNGGIDNNYSGALHTMPAGETDIGPSTGLLPDFARSSRGPRTSTNGRSADLNELHADTFWGFAQDGVEVAVFNGRGAVVQGAGGTAITPNELYHIYNCDYTTWHQVPSLHITSGSANDGPIVAWGMNPSSGTYATFNTFLTTSGGAPVGFAADAQACVKAKVTSPAAVYPLENDIKEIVNAPTVPALSTANDVNNPKNWIWWGSFGAFSAYPATSKTVRAGTTVTAIAAPVNGVLPSTSGILAGTYPIGRTLYHVTRKNDADCPQSPAGTCNFTSSPGPLISAGVNDLNVLGPSSGNRGAVREYTRFLCRVSASQEGVDPFTGTNLFSEVTGALNKSGFTTVPVGLRSSGSRCQVLSS